MFERVSLVDKAFAADSRFEDMDFATRTLYRSAVEELARGSTHTELQDRRRRRCKRRRASGPDSATRTSARRGDPGYHLLTGGRRAFEAALAFRRLAAAMAWRGSIVRSGIAGYIGAIAVVALILLALPLYALADAGLSLALLSALATLGAIPAIDAAVAFVNRGVNFGFRGGAIAGLGVARRRPRANCERSSPCRRC